MSPHNLLLKKGRKEGVARSMVLSLREGKDHLGMGKTFTYTEDSFLRAERVRF